MQLNGKNSSTVLIAATTIIHREYQDYLNYISNTVRGCRREYACCDVLVRCSKFVGVAFIHFISHFVSFFDLLAPVFLQSNIEFRSYV